MITLHKIQLRSLAISLLFAAIFVPASSVFASEGNRVEEHVERLQEKLGLSEAQVSQLYDIFKSEAPPSSNCREIEIREEKKECIMKKRKEIHSQIEDILTEEQLAKFQTLQEERKERFKDRR